MDAVNFKKISRYYAGIEIAFGQAMNQQATSLTVAMANLRL